MIVLLQVASAPICSYRLAYLHACGQGGVEGLPGEAGAAPADREVEGDGRCRDRWGCCRGCGGFDAGVDFVF